MSYCRRGDDSDVYVFQWQGQPGILCFECLLCVNHEGHCEDWRGQSPQEMIEHLGKHRASGHMVPNRAFKRLRAEAEDNTSNS